MSIESTSGQCSLCGKTKLVTKMVCLPFFRHIDFSTVAKSSNVIICNYCGVVDNRNLFVKENWVFGTREYFDTNQTLRFIKNKNAKTKTRSEIQAEIISGVVKKDRPSVLDIGCFDGRLLIELSQRFDNAILIGYDVSVSKVLLGDSISHVKLLSDLDEALSVQYDVVVISHSISYLDQLSSLLSRLRSILKKDGKLFIQMPNLSTNPYYALMGDQLHTFSPSSLLKALTVQGFSCVEINATEFPREFIVVAHSVDRKSEESELTLGLDTTYLSCIYQLEKKKNVILEIKNHSCEGVFGTSVNAAFVDEIAGDQVQYFVDEFVTDQHNKFRGKPIRSLCELSSTDKVFFPYGANLYKTINKRSRCQLIDV